MFKIRCELFATVTHRLPSFPTRFSVMFLSFLNFFFNSIIKSHPPLLPLFLIYLKHFDFNICMCVVYEHFDAFWFIIIDNQFDWIFISKNNYSMKQTNQQVVPRKEKWTQTTNQEYGNYWIFCRCWSNTGSTNFGSSETTIDDKDELSRDESRDFFIRSSINPITLDQPNLAPQKPPLTSRMSLAATNPETSP